MIFACVRSMCGPSSAGWAAAFSWPQLFGRLLVGRPFWVPKTDPLKRGAIALLHWLTRGARRVIRGTLSWASLFAIPLGIGVGLMGHTTLGALLVLGGTLCYFLVDPILFILDLKPSEEPEQQHGGQRRSGR
jgi:hypothetical protein